MTETVRPVDYNRAGNINTYPGDVLQSMSGNAHYNTHQENLANRPSMKQDNHPEHNMPTPEHNGVEVKANDGGAP